jgi:hypothetical protein
MGLNGLYSLKSGRQTKSGIVVQDKLGIGFETVITFMCQTCSEKNQGVSMQGRAIHQYLSKAETFFEHLKNIC